MLSRAPKGYSAARDNLSALCIKGNKQIQKQINTQACAFT